MELETTYVDVPIGDATMRTLVAAPANENQYPGIVFYSDIFQLTPSTTRWVMSNPSTLRPTREAS